MNGDEGEDGKRHGLEPVCGRSALTRSELKGNSPAEKESSRREPAEIGARRHAGQADAPEEDDPW